MDNYAPLLNNRYSEWKNKSGVVYSYEHTRPGTGFRDFDNLDYVRYLVKNRISNMISFLNDKDEAIQTRRLALQTETDKLIARHKALLEDIEEEFVVIRKKFLVETYYTD